MNKSKKERGKSIIFKINKNIMKILVPSLIILIALSCMMAAKSVSSVTLKVAESQSDVAVNNVDDFFHNKITAVSIYENNSDMHALLK